MLLTGRAALAVSLSIRWMWQRRPLVAQTALKKGESFKIRNLKYVQSL